MSASNAGRIGVWGASGSGKSSYVKYRLLNLHRLVVFDPQDEYGKLKMTRCTTVEQVRKAMIAKWRTFRIAYVPPAGKEARALHQLSLLLMKAQAPFKEAGRGAGLTLMVEEMNLCFPVRGGEDKAPGFANICSRGRHYGIEVIGASQRIAEVSTRFRGNCTETVILRQIGKNDMMAARNTTGLSDAQLMAMDNMDIFVCKAGKFTPGKVFWKNRKPHVTLSNHT